MSWWMLNEDGTSSTAQMDKRQLTQVMGLEIPMRDLRLMDPALGSTFDTYAQILVRENAMVVSIEYVRLIISADKLLIPLDFERTDQTERFIKSLEAVVRERATCVMGQRGQDMGGMSYAHASNGNRPGTLDLEQLPFELTVLEQALGEICRHLSMQVTAMEQVAHPALDALTKACNTVNLERVRKIKTQHQRLTNRVQSLREALDRYMEDDQDMYRMCLTRRREQELEPGGSDNTLLLGRTAARVAALKTSRSHGHHGHSFLSRSHGSPPGAFDRMGSMPNRHGDDSSSSSSGYGELVEVENLLESYFMMVDSTAAKLAGIGEYIDDTEDYINIELDHTRNRLLKIEIMLTVATFALAIYNLVAGILGENLVLPSSWTADLRGFIIINSTTLSLAVGVFCLTWTTMKRMKVI